MTEQELDLLMRNVLLDAIAMDEETQPVYAVAASSEADQGNAQEPSALGA